MPATWTALSASVQGALHASQGKKNQDAVRLHRAATASDALVLAVADGHGSPRSFRSERGAVLATECALRTLRAFERRNGPEVPLSRLRQQLARTWPRALLATWHAEVRKDLAKHPFSPMDFAAVPDDVPVLRKGAELPFIGYLAYGATLVVAAVTPRYILYAQLGDGDILMVQENGEVSRPWPREHAFFSMETVSLCSHHALQEFKVRVEPRRAAGPAMILLATDGYSNCFEDDAGFFTVGREFLGYLRAGGPGFVEARLERWLTESSRDGSQDDITAGLAVRLNALGGKDFA
jgi:serine/threonine protein phosphatase PrpC